MSAGFPIMRAKKHAAEDEEAAVAAPPRSRFCLLPTGAFSAKPLWATTVCIETCPGFRDRVDRSAHPAYKRA